MSGGLWDYKDKYLRYEIFGWDNEKTNVFEDIEISELIYDVFDLLHDFDWYQSGDTGEDDWLKSKHKFKCKWFDNNDARTKELIDLSIESLRQELYKSFDSLNAPLPPDRPNEDAPYEVYCPHCGIQIDRTWFMSGGTHYCDACGGAIDYNL